MTTAFVFPGQGSQTPGMAEDFYEEWPEMRRSFSRLNDAAERDLRELCFGATAETLTRTRHTQPAVYAVGAAVAAAVTDRYDIRPDVVAGHSLGHFTAAASADLYAATDGMALVSKRGAAMEEAGRDAGPGKMVAVLFADPAVVEDVCGNTEGVSVAAYNTPNQTVVSGFSDAVEAACDRIDERTRARFRELNVGAAFHSPVMASAVDAITTALEDTPMKSARLPIVSDVTGEPYTAPETARRDLTAQVLSPVDWRAVVDTFDERGVDRIVEFPPAGTLGRFVSRIDDEATVVTLETPEDAEDAFR